MMRALLAVAFILAAGSASAQDDAPHLRGSLNWGDWEDRGITITPACHDHFPDLPKIAERLGVAEYQGRGPTTVLMMCDGRSYSLFELVAALLDRMDKAAAIAGP